MERKISCPPPRSLHTCFIFMMSSIFLYNRDTFLLERNPRSGCWLLSHPSLCQQLWLWHSCFFFGWGVCSCFLTYLELTYSFLCFFSPITINERTFVAENVPFRITRRISFILPIQCGKTKKSRMPLLTFFYSFYWTPQSRTLFIYWKKKEEKRTKMLLCERRFALRHWPIGIVSRWIMGFCPAISIFNLHLVCFCFGSWCSHTSKAV
jgi:hypothetical protein